MAPRTAWQLFDASRDDAELYQCLEDQGCRTETFVAFDRHGTQIGYIILTQGG